MQRPFYPEKEVCHVYALHPPGGVVGGDRLMFDIRSHPEAHGLVTTPSAGKFYRSSGPPAFQNQRLAVASGGALDWLPLETIVYPGANARLSTQVHLEGDAAFFGWDVVCLGLPASDRPYDRGILIQALEIYRDGEPILLERTLLEGGAPMLREPWGLGGYTVIGTLTGTIDDAIVTERIRERANNFLGDVRLSLTCIDGLTVCRAMGNNAFQVRGLLADAWNAMRLGRLGRPACPPRVWNT